MIVYYDIMACLTILKTYSFINFILACEEILPGKYYYYQGKYYYIYSMHTTCDST